ncbi:MAG TPA: hypothetical protein VKZ87_06845 [Ferrovibrio sp.]|jgi:hypothetical protein|uniref:hypothetical protein n=1 Tax=Ferrovibrio sp. TaxID=1917215 RepID=UPI002B4B4372|nr:hypothetical protein [Ferrovibrio sp.]HLT77086.1 hypothetical protein [Ferrovibrio sp.]
MMLSQTEAGALDLETARAFLDAVTIEDALFEDPERVDDWYAAVGDLFHALLCLIALRVQTESGRTITLEEMNERIRTAPHGFAVQEFFVTLDNAPHSALIAIPPLVKRQLFSAILHELMENYVVVAVGMLGDQQVILVGERLSDLARSFGLGARAV